MNSYRSAGNFMNHSASQAAKMEADRLITIGKALKPPLLGAVNQLTSTSFDGRIKDWLEFNKKIDAPWRDNGALDWIKDANERIRSAQISECNLSAILSAKQFFAINQIADAYKSTLNPSADYLAKIEAIKNPLAIIDMEHDYSKYFDLLNNLNIQDQIQGIKSWEASFKGLTGILDRYKDSLNISSIEEIFDHLETASRMAALAQPDFKEKGEYVDFQQRAEETFKSISTQAETQPTLQQAVDQIVAAIAASKEPRTQKMLWLILIPSLLMLINAIITPISDFYVKKYLESLSNSNAETIKAIKKDVREQVGDIKLLGNYRFVSKASLIVHLNARAQSPQISQIKLGQVVRILEKERDFTLVEWRSEDGKASLQGWVFSRYLKRFD